MKIPTYPARPVNGGPFDKAPPKSGDWAYEPKVNGWRALLHVPTGEMYNRLGEPFARVLQMEFREAIKEIQTIRGNYPIMEWLDVGDWLDCEAIARRHDIGKGSLIVLDYVPGRIGECGVSYKQRREILESLFNEFDLNTTTPFPRVSIPPWLNTSAWKTLQVLNDKLRCQFYEGLVAKRKDSVYPMQLRSPDWEFPFWVKHRWAF